MDRAAAARALGVAPTASAAEVKKAYHARAREHHPDKGGDAEAFKRAKAAYDVLTGAAGGVGPGASPVAHPPRPPAPPRPTRATLTVSLAELCTGCVKRVRFERTRFPKGCAVRPCAACAGRGVAVRVVRLGPHVQQHIQSPCAACQGTGRTADGGAREAAQVDVAVPRGARHGHVVQIRGEGEQRAGEARAADLLVEVRQAKDPEWTREGDDLRIAKSLTLGEALLGTQLRLDVPGREGGPLHARVEGVVRHGERRRIRGLGVRPPRRPAGDVVVELAVQMPSELSEAQRAALAEAFPPPEASSPAPTHTLERAEP